LLPIVTVLSSLILAILSCRGGGPDPAYALRRIWDQG
jgi:hypothetical protein